MNLGYFLNRFQFCSTEGFMKKITDLVNRITNNEVLHRMEKECKVFITNNNVKKKLQHLDLCGGLLQDMLLGKVFERTSMFERTTSNLKKMITIGLFRETGNPC